MRKLQQYDRGAVLSLPIRDEDGVALQLVGGETARLLLESPSARRKTLQALVDVPAQAVRAVTQTMDFDEFGTWRVQAEVETANYHVRGQVTLLEVGSNIDIPHQVVRLSTAEVWFSAEPLRASFV